MKVSNYPLLSCWAQETSNKISFSQTEFQNGILYKGSIVSNQLNGVSYILSQILQYQQCSGGLYQSNMTYHKGNFVSVLHKGYTTPLRVETYRCINDNEGAGITNRPPLNDAVIVDENGVPLYTNGVVNYAYWQRVDVGSDVEIEPQEFTPDSNAEQYITELCRVAEIDYTQGDSPIREVNADLWITTYLGNKSCAVNLKIHGRYIVNKDKTKYIAPRDYFNMPVPNVSIGECIFFDGVEYNNDYIPAQKISYANALTNKTINIDNLYSGTITPYGFNVWVGYTTTNAGTKIWSIYLAFNEADKITMSGSSNIDLSIKNRTDKANINIQNVIPVRPNGGATNNYEELLSLREYDSPSSTAQEIMLHYSRGEVELRNARVLNLGSLQESVYRILGRMQGVTSATLKEHTGRHTRAYGGNAWETDGSIYAGAKAGDLLEPGLPLCRNDYNPPWHYAKGGGGSGGGCNNRLLTNYLSYEISEIGKEKFADVRAKSVSVSRYIRIF